MNDDDIRLQKKLPDFITITLELWDVVKQKSESFVFTVPIAWQEIKHKPKSPQQQPKKGQAVTRAQMQQQPQQSQQAQQMQRR